MGQGVNDPPPGETMHKKDSSTRRARATSSVGSSAQGEPNQQKAGRERSSTMAGEGHDHEEGFPAHEREQMSELLESMSGTLGEFRSQLLSGDVLSLTSVCSRFPYPLSRSRVGWWKFLVRFNSSRTVLGS